MKDIMASLERQVEHTEQVMHNLAERGRKWVSFEQVALESMLKEQTRRRGQRSVIMNSVRDLLSLDGRPTRASLRARHRISRGIATLEMDGRIERRYVDGEGAPLETPPIPCASENVRYRLTPMETEVADDVSPVETGDIPTEAVDPRRMHDASGPHLM